MATRLTSRFSMPPEVKKCSYFLDSEIVRGKLQKLRDESILTDVTLTCNGTTIMAHRCILSVNSQYFREPMQIAVHVVCWEYVDEVIKLYINLRLELEHVGNMWTSNVFCKPDPEMKYHETIDVSAHSSNAPQVKSVIDFMYTGAIIISEYNIVEILNLSIIFICHDLLNICSEFVQTLVTRANCVSMYLKLSSIQMDGCLLAFREEIEKLLAHVRNIVETNINDAYFTLNDFGKLTTGDIKHLLAGWIGTCLTVQAACRYAVDWLCDHLNNGGVEACKEFLNLALKQATHLKPDIHTIQQEVCDLSDKLDSVLRSSEISTTLQADVRRQMRNILARLRNEDIEVEKPDSISQSPVPYEADDHWDSDSTVDFDYSATNIDFLPTAIKPELPWTKNDVAGTNNSSQETNTHTLSDLNAIPSPTTGFTRSKQKGNKQSGRKKLRTKSHSKNTKNNIKSEQMDQDKSSTDRNVLIIQSENESKKNGSSVPTACNICDKKFVRSWHLNRHMRTSHSKEQTHLCILCDTRFSRKEHIRRHMNRLHHEDAPYTCPKCSMTIDTVREIVDHMDAHYNPAPVKVKDATSTSPPNCKKRVVNEGTPTLRCQVCDKTFSRQVNLRTHQRRMHTDEKPFHCATCDKSFFMKHDYNNHLMRHSGQRPYGCDNCGKTFHNKGYRQWHYKICSGHPDVRKITCEYCGQLFKKTSHFKRHLVTHTDARPYSCSKCNMSFKHPNNLKNHMKIHTVQIRRFICSVCHHGFYHKTVLKRHMLIHDGIRAHVCKYCNKDFTQKSSLKMHLLIHEGQGTYQCGVCSKKYATQSKLQHHYNVVHLGDLPFRCKMCPAGFVYQHQLVQHVLKHNEMNNV